jgi:hypothetical protein
MSIFGSSLKVWENSELNPSGHGVFFIWRYFIIVQNPLFVIDIFELFMSSWISFGGNPNVNDKGKINDNVRTRNHNQNNLINK